MTVSALTRRDHAVGIHVSQTLRCPYFQSNGRVKPCVHLRIRLFDPFWHCFGTVWPYLALFGPMNCIWDPENEVYGTLYLRS